MMKQSKLILSLYLVALYLPYNLAHLDAALPRSDDLGSANNVGDAAAPATPISDAKTSAAPASAPVDSASRHEQLVPDKDAKSTLKEILATTASPVHHLSVSAPTSMGALPSVAPPLAVASLVHHLTPHTTAAPVLLSDAHDEPKGPTHRFCDYMKPICASVDRIQSKQLFKIQMEFKQFVQLTNGKLASCFLDHFSFDPILKPMTHFEIKTICSSKKLAANFKDSYKSFETCAVKNWDPALDKELDKINEARANYLKSHDHKSASADHDDDLALISEVVSQVLSNDKSVVNNSDIRIIDMNSPTGKSATAAPAVHGSRSAVAPGPAPGPKESLMNDPNTMLIFVDDSKTTAAPAHLVSAVKDVAAVKPTVKAVLASVTPASTSHAPVHIIAVTTAKPLIVAAPIMSSEAPKVVETTKDTVVKKEVVKDAKTVVKDPVKVKEVVKEAVVDIKPASFAHKIMPSASPSVAPVMKMAIISSVAPLVAHVAEVTSPKPAIVSLTTKKVVVSLVTTKAASVVELKPSMKTLLLSTAQPLLSAVKTKAVSVSVAPSVAPKLSAKPFDTLEEVFKRQEKEKQDLENKLRAEREKVLKQLQKKQDEIDAQNAMKSLQVQRDATSGPTSDAKLHQLEHERQMAIDPVGHQIKHQQYELSKQQRLNSKL